MTQLWAKPDAWYKANPKPTKDADIAQGFGITIENYNRLKERVEDVAIKVKPEHVTYRGNSTMMKEGHVEEFCKQLPQFANAPPDWKLRVIPKIMGSACSNRARRVLSTSNKSKNLPLREYTSPQKTEARDETTPPQLLHATQPMDVTANPLPGIPSPQPATPAASNAIDMGDIEIEIQSTGLTGKSMVGVVQVSYLMSGNPHTALGKLREELRAYTELNIDGPPEKNIYISPWRHENLAIRSEGTLIAAFSEMAKNGTKEAVLVALFSPPSSNSRVAATNNTPPAIESEAPGRSAKDSQQVPTSRKASGKSKLGEGKKRSRSGSAAHGSKEDSESEPVRHKKSDNGKTKSGRHNKWPQLRSATSALAEDNESEPAAPGKSNSRKANLNRRRKRPRPESAAGTLTESSDNEPVVRRRRLARGRRNPSAHEPTSTSDSGTGEIAADNGKSPQPITEPAGTHQPDNVIDDPTAASPTVDTPRDVTAEDSKLPQRAGGHDNQFPHHTNSKDAESGDKDEDSVNDSDRDEDLVNDDDQDEDSVNDDDQDVDAEEELNQQNFLAQLYQAGKDNLDSALAHVTEADLLLTLEYFPLVSLKALSETALIELPNWGLASGFKFSPYQVVYVAWAFKQERTIKGGGICADEPGAGKTVQMITQWLMNYFHYQNVMDVQEARAVGDVTRHLPEMHPPDTKCPQAAKQPIACYCEDNSKKLYPTDPQRGCSVVLTPNPGLPGFLKDASAMLGDGAIMKRPNPPRITILAPGYDKVEMFGKLKKDEWPQIRKALEWTNEEQWENDNNTYTVGKTLLSHPWGKARFENNYHPAPDATELSAPKHSTRFLLITTRNCITTRLIREFITTRTSTWKHPTGRSPRTHQVSKSAMQVGRILWDECHLDATGRVLMSFIQDVVKEYRIAYNRSPAVWGVSGTPDNGNPMQPMRFIMAGLKRPEWEEADKLKGTEFEVLLELKEENIQLKKKEFNRLCEDAKTNPARAVADRKFGELAAFFRTVIPTFQIRRGESTLWFNQQKLIPKNSYLKLVTLQADPNDTEAAIITAMEDRVRTEQRRRHKELLAIWEEDGSDLITKPEIPQLTQAESYTNAKTAASVAQVVQYWDQQAPIVNESDDKRPKTRSCTLKDPIIAKWTTNPLGKEFTDMLDHHFQQNAKFFEAKKICDCVHVEKRTDGSACKIVIATRSPLTLACWFNRLCKEYGKDKVLRYAAGMSNIEKAEARQTFDTDDSKWILLCTFASIGLSINLQRANYTIMVEPSHKLSEVKQLFARIDRRGQTEPVCYGTIIANQKSSIEQRMLKSTEFTSLLQKSVYEEKAGSSSKVG